MKKTDLGLRTRNIDLNTTFTHIKAKRGKPRHLWLCFGCENTLDHLHSQAVLDQFYWGGQGGSSVNQRGTLKTETNDI